MSGTLFVVATPIGNLEDLTFRALRTLREVDLIAAEDTRRTSKLLAHYEIQKPLVSLREHNESRETPRLVGRLAEGQNVALVSDAGTPAISDPGEHLVAAARTAGILVVPVPGPSAITAVLSASGLPGSPFTFMGFPPSSGLEREEWFSSIQDEPGTVVFFESPHRIARTMGEAANLFGKRHIIVGREISKIHEKLVTWDKIGPIAGSGGLKGEFVVVVGPDPGVASGDVDGFEANRIVGLITEQGGFDDEAGVRGAAAILNLPVRRVRNAVKKARISLKRAENLE